MKHLWFMLVCVGTIGKACAGMPANFEQICDLPLVCVCPHFLSDEECDHIIHVAKGSLKRSTVVNPEGAGSLVDHRRTSLGTYISEAEEDRVIVRIYKRIAKATGIPVENGENAQILYYREGGEYCPHYDYFDPNTKGGLIHYERGGQRIASFLIYLNTTEEGGETIFPKAKIKVKPEKGKAVLFYNVDETGAPEPMSLHGGAPVIAGEKWLMTRWLRQGVFH